MAWISRDSRVAVSSRAIYCDLLGATAVLNMETGAIHELEGAAHRIWQLLETPTDVLDLRDRLTSEYDIEPERCLTDLLEVLGDLATRGLVTVSDGERW